MKRSLSVLVRLGFSLLSKEAVLAHGWDTALKPAHVTTAPLNKVWPVCQRIRRVNACAMNFMFIAHARLLVITLNSFSLNLSSHLFLCPAIVRPPPLHPTRPPIIPI